MSGEVTPLPPTAGPFHGDGGRAGLIFGGIALPSSVLGALIVGRSGGLATALLGPWAGVAVGHHDCTMATLFPLASIGLVFAGFALLLGLALGRPLVRGIVLGGIALWSLAWCGSGLVSMLNASI